MHVRNSAALRARSHGLPRISDQREIVVLTCAGKPSMRAHVRSTQARAHEPRDRTGAGDICQHACSLAVPAPVVSCTYR
eukprot:6202442-Pleurochrysis_carterae.AAC.2